MTQNQPGRVLLIGELGLTQEQIASAFSTSSEFQLTEVMTTVDRLSIDVNAIAPDMILLDQEIAGANLLTLVDDLALRFPGISTVVLLQEDSPQVTQQVMLAGARAFLHKPFTQVELVNTLRRVSTLDQARRRFQGTAGPATTRSERPLQTVTIFSPKGGVGCSVLATNLAIAYYQEHGGRVLLMDGKLFFGHLDVTLNIMSGNSIADLIPHASNLDEALIDDVVQLHSSGIHVLLAPRNVQVAQGIRADNLFSVFMGMQRSYDMIFIDAGSALNENSVTLMDSADRILLVATPDLPTLHDVSQFIQFSSSLAIPLNKLLVVINREGVIGGVRMRDIESSLGQGVFGSIPDDEANAIRSLNRGVPLVLRYPRSPASRAIRELSKKLARISQVVEKESPLPAAGVAV